MRETVVSLEQYRVFTNAIPSYTCSHLTPEHPFASLKIYFNTFLHIPCKMQNAPSQSVIYFTTLVHDLAYDSNSRSKGTKRKISKLTKLNYNL